LEKLTLTIRTDGKEAELNLTSPTNSLKQQALNGTFQLFGITVASVEFIAEPLRPLVVREGIRLPKSSEIPREAIAKPITESMMSSTASTIKHKSNKVEIPNEIMTMEEALMLENADDDQPLHYKTGYKIVDGKRHYKCRYRCTKCGTTGNHYIPEGVEFVDCHECQSSLLVKKATPGSVGLAADKFKNWFVAGDQLPVHGFIHEYNKK
jgi:DNA-directed RNA polymerase subunit RPC12/RpoP